MSSILKGTTESQVPGLTKTLEFLYREIPGKTSDEIVTEQGRLFGRNAMRITPPFSKAQGRAAVASDIRRAIIRLDPKNFWSKDIKRAIRNRDARVISRIIPEISAAEIDGSIIFSEEHEKRRNRRGRVHKQVYNPVYTFEGPALNRYIRSKQDNVGMGKGGWAAGMISLGGKAPQWIARHTNQGHIVDGRKKPGQGSFVLFVNRSPWATDKESRRIRDAAIKTTEKNAKLRAEHILRAQLKKAEKQLARAQARIGFN